MTSKVLRYDLVLRYNIGLKTNDILIRRCYIVDTLDFSLQLKEWLRIVSETHSEASQARKRFQCSFFLNRIFDQPIWELYSFNHGQISSEFNFTVDIALLGHIAALVRRSVLLQRSVICVSLCVCVYLVHDRMPRINVWTDRDAIWDLDSLKLKKPSSDGGSHHCAKGYFQWGNIKLTGTWPDMTGGWYTQKWLTKG